jgi:hypothetical protein
MPNRVSFDRKAAWLRERLTGRSTPSDAADRTGTAQQDELPGSGEAIYEPYLTPADVAKILKVSHDRARRLVRNDPRVIILPGPGGPGTRRYETIRIPRPVFEDLLRRWRPGSTGS